MSKEFDSKWLADFYAKKKTDIPNRATIPDTKQCERKETLATSCEGKAQGAGLLHVCFTLARKKLLDVDAKYASTKDLLDFLAKCGVISGDREGQITLEVNQVKSKAEFTRIEVYES